VIQVFNQLLVQLATIVERVGWVEVIDVLLVAVILYQFLRLFRGTQAIQLIVGLVVFVMIGVAASALKLVLLSWLFQNAAPSIVLAIIVLFQPELRRILDQVGRIGHIGRPLGGFSDQQLNRAMLEVVRAAERLSARRTGALVAFEREVGLEDYAATGVRINGDVSSEFLQTIFFPNSPLHDGAVIIRGNQILAAGCLLPLPEEGTVRERLGTRHRAAIGLSLASDALIVVVSEETGVISVVENGRISRNLDPEALRRRLAGGTPTGHANGRRFTILSWLHEVRAR
jgi:diadenylate cyclase